MTRFSIPDQPGILPFQGIETLIAIGAIAGGARIGRGIVRVLVWGSAAMAITSGIGHVFGIAA